MIGTKNTLRGLLSMVGNVVKISIEEFGKDKDLKIAWRALWRGHIHLADYAIKRYLSRVKRC